VFEQCRLDASVELKVSFNVPKYVYNFSKQLIHREIKMLKAAASEKLSVDSEERGNSGNMVFKISTSHLDDLILAKYRLSSLLNGHPVHLDCHQFRYLKSPVGQLLLKSFADETKANVRLDERQGAAYIHAFTIKLKN
jgi:hypothetical protein